ncbi:MAG: recombinase family protein [Bacillota bacterium]|nr:recombinase family protein [Bacillota bacterium]
MFDEFRSGASARGISEKLNIEKIDSPRFFCFSNGSGQKPKANEHNSWSSSTILSMIRNQVYIGNMVQGKREVVSFKKKTRRAVDPSQWIIVENTHEPIIDRSTWDDVQSRIVNGKHHVRRTKSADKIGLFSGCAICGDCGLKLAYYKRNSYRCSLFNNAGKEACSPHSIRESTLSEFVLNDIRHYAVLAKAVRDKIRQRLIRDMSKSRINETKLLERKISELEAKQREN